MTARGPVDPALPRLSASARRWILLAAALSALDAAAIIAAGVLVGRVAAGAITDEPATAGGALPGAVPALAALAAVAVARAALAWAKARWGRRAAAGAVEELRARTLRALAHSDPRTVDRAAWRTLLADGLEGLGPYLSGYLPALAATLIATPAALVAVWWADAPSALIAVVTLPLIPLFMWLIGTLTAGRTARRLRDLGLLGDQMLDLVAGLPTLRALHRADAPVAEIRRLSRAHGESTMSVLRIAFLSGMALEFLATLSVALVAVGIGFRLVDGSMTLEAGLIALIIVPEVYAPVRAVGTRFHDAQDGLAALQAIAALLRDDASRAPSDPVPATPAATTAPGGTPTSGATAEPRAVLPASGLRLVFAGVTAAGRDGARPRDLAGIAEPGRVTALAGPNGAGKSTALLAALGIASDGVSGVAAVLSPGGPLRGEALWARTAYVPQRPVANRAAVGGGTPRASLGERQRAAVAEALAGGADLLLLDEPTAHLDAARAEAMLDDLAAQAAAGATVVVATHDPLVLARADAIVEVTA
ncbi:ABC transporter transmembrane domain-containing protein [Corynebacterium sp.]|uniref:ABC transporter transmembrane domain-containing protein n=1 Tax=Corynebacterium sp. TaxID=1720 RepID=UPI0026DD1B49|nr:ABC transporter transmembrane domain-containing protein [Corynebacterium sp.]MDO4609851.1 ABC transporter transmembrane domain-containing protein [Corynebacterium sp.]